MISTPLFRMTVFLLTTSFLCPLIAADEPQTILLTDMSLCTPQEALASGWQQDAWRLIPYSTSETSGTMLAAQSFVEAPEVRLPLQQTGWYAISLGVWNPELMYDGRPIVRARLSSRKIFQQIHPGPSPDTQDATCLEEVFFSEADLTNESYLAFGKSNGLQPRSAYIAWVKLVPLSDERVRQIKARRKDRSSANLVATYDGSSLFHYSECTDTPQYLEWVEKLRDSDTRKVLWAVTYGDRTGFPTQNPELTYLGQKEAIREERMPFGNAYRRGRVQMQRFFRDAAESDKVPLQDLCEHTQSMDMEFDLMFRIGFLGGLGVSELWSNNFVQRHPEVRQVTHDGTVLQKASLAFPLVQDLILSQIRESCRQINADGINLCFVRGPHFLRWEPPVRQAFEKRYGVSPDSIAADDPRIQQARCDVMTGFLQRVSQTLQELGRERQRPFGLSVWVWPHDRNVWLGRTPRDEGLDVAEWIRRGWLNSVICQEGVDRQWMQLGKQHDCEFVLFTGYRGKLAMSPTTIGEAAQQGVRTFAWWDIDAVQHDPRTWQWLRQTGNLPRLQQFRDTPPQRTIIPLQTVNNVNVETGLADAIYSGG